MTKTIMIVDDEPSIRTSLEGVLEDEGYKVICASDGNEALKTIEEEMPDLILLDIWMPGIDGIETLRAYALSPPEAPGYHDIWSWQH